MHQIQCIVLYTVIQIKSRRKTYFLRDLSIAREPNQNEIMAAKIALVSSSQRIFKDSRMFAPCSSASNKRDTSIAANKPKKQYVIIGLTDFCNPAIKPVPALIEISVSYTHLTLPTILLV